MDEVIGIRFPASIVEALDAIAHAEDRPRSFIVRRLIARGLDAERTQRTMQEAP